MQFSLTYLKGHNSAEGDCLKQFFHLLTIYSNEQKFDRNDLLPIWNVIRKISI